MDLRRWIAVLALPLACAKGNGAPGEAAGADSGSEASGADGGDGGFVEDGSATAPFEIRPADVVLSATGAPIAQQLEAFDVHSQTRVSPRWALDVSLIGDLDSSTGLFTANGV